MKKLTSILFTCLLVGTSLAQQPDDQPDPKHKKGKGHNSEEKAAPPEAKHAAPEAKKAPAAPKQEKHEARKTSVASEALVGKKREPRKVSEAPAAERSSGEAVVRKHAAKTEKETAKISEPVTRSTDEAKKRLESNAGARERAKAEREKNRADVAKAERDKASRDGAKSKKSDDAAEITKDRRNDSLANTTTDRPTRTRKTEARRPAPDKIQEIRTRHENFRAEARPDRVPTVTFSESRRIENSDRWQGAQYEAFRSYRPERHDERYYRSRYDRVELIGGGYYYLSNNYWYPAWGYQPSAEYYAYDGPVYAGKRAVPPDRVIADVQDALQDLGYYKGEVDGLLGPLTRGALTGYQDDEGLEITAAIDEPTLDQLGLN